ncbi:MAG: hypothetical protein WD696_03780 [Bryobacteraceae bacterium]
MSRILAISLLLSTYISAQVTYRIDTIAGSDYVGDGGNAIAAQLASAVALALDAQGNLYIADSEDHRVRKVDATGLITTVAGNGHAGFAGDGGPARDALLNGPHGVAVDAAGNVYIADLGNARVRRISPEGIMTTFAGGGLTLPGSTGDATAARLLSPRNLALDAAGNLYISDMIGHRVCRVTPNGIISVIAGTGVPGGRGEDDPATAQLNNPMGLAIGPEGALFIVDHGNHRIRKVHQNRITTVLEGGPNTSTRAAILHLPRGVATDGAGNLIYCRHREFTNSEVHTIRTAHYGCGLKDNSTARRRSFRQS